MSKEQPAPRPNASTPIIDLVLRDCADPGVAADLRARAELGRQRYGVYLQAGNGRDALRDAYEESLDQVMYLRQAWEESVGPLERLVLIELFAAEMAQTIRIRRQIGARAAGRST